MSMHVSQIQTYYVWGAGEGITLAVVLSLTVTVFVLLFSVSSRMIKLLVFREGALGVCVVCA